MSKGNHRDMWVFCEQNRGEFVPVTVEMLGEARRLMDAYNKKYKEKENVVAFIAGHNVEGLVGQAYAAGADVVYVADHQELETFRLEPFTKLVAKAAEGSDDYKSYDGPRYFLFPATNNGRDLSATVMAALESGLASDCNYLYIEDFTTKHPVKTRNAEGKIEERTFERILHMKRPDFSGFEWSTILCVDDPDKDFHPQACSVIPGSFRPIQPRTNVKGQRIDVAMDLSGEAFRIKTLSREQLPIEVDLTKPDVIVAIGRGISKNPTQGIKLAVELANALGGDVGCSRGVVTAKYTVDPSVEKYTREVRQIGETGQMVEPKLYVALGISGAIQHKKGMDKSRVIVAINTDDSVPIKEFSDVFIQGDLFDVVPKIKEQLVSLLKASSNGGKTPTVAAKKTKSSSKREVAA